MNKKIIFTLAIAALAVIAVASISAADNVETVTIDGINFTVPDGFTEDPSQEYVNEQKEQAGVTYIVNGKLYEKGNTVIFIMVSDYGDYKVTDDVVKAVGGDAKTINGQSGYIKEDNGFKVFSYEQDDKLVALSTNDENVIGDFIA